MNNMKHFLALCLVIVLCFTGCTMESKGASEIVTTVQETIAETSDVTEIQESETQKKPLSPIAPLQQRHRISTIHH